MPTLKQNIPFTFDITSYGEQKAWDDTKTIGRCRIFYKYANRNGSYITDEFAEKLIASLPYTPVKGIFDAEENDYTDHGQVRSEGRIYGVVPENPNFAWEKHTDDDGVEREYACVDVLYYTGIYPEANAINGKAQSMELYRKSLKGDWQFIEGKRRFVYTDGCFLGLQVLGDSVEPCYEGAGFFNLKNQTDETTVNALNELIALNEKQEDKAQMHLFKLSHDDIREILYSLLNTEVDEDGYTICQYGICKVYDDYCITVNYADWSYERVYYTKDENDTVTLGQRVSVKIVDVTEEEAAALDKIKGGKDSFSAAAAAIEELEAQNQELNTKNTENLESITTLNTERDNAIAQLQEVQAQAQEAQAQVESLTKERDELISFKKHIEDEEKLSVINQYVGKLPEEVIAEYTNNISQYSCEELDMHLTYKLKNAHPEMFSLNNKNTQGVQMVYNPEPKSGIESILSRYEKK